MQPASSLPHFMSDAVLIGKIINQEGKGVDHVVTREREREREKDDFQPECGSDFDEKTNHPTETR